MTFRSLALLTTSFILIGLGGQSSRAETQTLDDAFVLAYQQNPMLLSARADLKRLDEKVSSSKSSWRPQADGFASTGYTRMDFPQNAGRDRELRPRSVGVQVVQNVFKGFRTISEVRSAEKQVLSGRAKLEEAEQVLFLSVAKAYLNALHAQTVLDLRKANEEVLKQQFQSTEQRLKVGEVTQTDLAQANSRWDGTQAARVRAEGDLAASRATVARVIGQDGSLINKPVKPTLPDCGETQPLDQLIDSALKNNPSILAASYARDAAQYDVDLAKGRILPEVNLVGSVGRSWEQSPIQMPQQDTAQIMAQVTIPLSHGGIEFSKARSAMQDATVKRLQLDDVRLQVRENVIASWNQILATKAAIHSQKSRVDAAQRALYGVREEYKAGTRTTLDVLNSEQELLDAKVSLAEAERDFTLAALSLKSALGQLTAEKLNLPVEKYDPAVHYESVKSRWIGFNE